MSKKIPERYAPGELNRTRKNLGSLSREEAERLSGVLGGEVGVERTDKEIEERYRRLEDLNRRKRESFSKQSEKREEKSSPEGKRDIGHVRSPKIIRKPSYMERVRINFIASRMEHRILKRGTAYATFFSCIFKIREPLSPDFIFQGDELYFKPIENLVLSVERLLKINELAGRHRLPEGPTRKILEVLSSWDIEAIDIILNRFQKIPRQTVFEMGRNFCVYLFVPILRCIELDPLVHIEGALKRIYDFNVLAFRDQKKVVKKLKALYSLARESALTVFTDVKFRLYPMLLKFVSDRVYGFDDFFIAQRSNILFFLGLRPKDILTESEEGIPVRREKEELEEAAPQTGVKSALKEYVPKKTEASDPVSGQNEGLPVEKESADRAAGIEVSSRPDPGPFLSEKYLKVLDRLFPGAGFLALETYPDLYSYFQPLFLFPRGIELVPPEDPLLQITVFLEILKQLFYGFRTIKFGFIHDEKGDPVETQEGIDRITGEWHLFIDEVILKNYTTKLYDFCREVERNISLPKTEYGTKFISDLFWIKKLYLMPFLRFRSVGGGRPRLGTHIPRLFEEIKELTSLINGIADELEAAEEGDLLSCVKNPWDPVSFEIPNPVSERISALTASGDNLICRFRVNKGGNNANLLLCTRAVLSLFDSLVNTRESFYYSSENTHVYRGEESGKRFPVYSVPLQETERILNSSLLETAPLLNIPGFLESGELKAALRKRIDKYHESQEPFSLLLIGFKEGQNLPEKNSEKERNLILSSSKIIKKAIRENSDLCFRWDTFPFFVVLPNTLAREAVSLAVRYHVLSKEAGLNYRPAIGVFPFHKTWGPEKILKVAVKTAGEAASFNGEPLEGEGSVCIYDPSAGEFRKLPLLGHQI